jgi:enterochelin esterase family protein
MHIDLTPPPWATHLISDLDDWMRAPRPATDLQPFELPDDAYFEYAWLDAQGRKRPDPANPNPPRNPWWEYARWLAGPHYAPEPIAAGASAAALGELRRLRLVSTRLGETRHVLVYSPAGCDDRALPHVWIQDGKAYLGWGKVPQVLDRLLASHVVEPAHLVFVPPAERTRDYYYNDAYLDFLVDEARPAVEALAPCDGRRTAWGASLGGLCSANLAWRHPVLFQTVVTQSGAFLFAPDERPASPYTGQEFWRARVEREPLRPLRWFVTTGTMEWLHAPNRNLAATLEGRGYAVGYLARAAGHNWVNWCDGIAPGLRFALPPES